MPHESSTAIPPAHTADETPKRRWTMSTFWHEVSSFGVIGLLNLFVDLGLYNLLIAGPLSHKLTTAKIISGAVATLLAWLGNRYWTFKHRENRPMHHEVALFFAVNGVALAATAGWVAFAHYVLGANGTLWNNFHAFLGIAIGTVIRFLAYRSVVFNANHDKDDATETAVRETLL